MALKLAWPRWDIQTWYTGHFRRGRFKQRWRWRELSAQRRVPPLGRALAQARISGRWAVITDLPRKADRILGDKASSVWWAGFGTGFH